MKFEISYILCQCVNFNCYMTNNMNKCTVAFLRLGLAALFIFRCSFTWSIHKPHAYYQVTLEIFVVNPILSHLAIFCLD